MLTKYAQTTEIMNYKYGLDTSSKKFHCPRCNRRSFVKFFNRVDNSYFEDKYGRCDHEQSCGYYLQPDRDEIDIPDLPFQLEEKPINYWDHSLVQASVKNFKENNFVQFLKSVTTEDEVRLAINRFLIGTSKNWNGSTVFWCIDEQNRVRKGKIMLYDKSSGKRIKTDSGAPLISSVRCAMKRYDLNLKQCLFGLHQVNDQTAKIGIVESEKTAIIGSIFLPDYTWMATGSLSNFNNNHLFPIKNQTIVAFPDRGCFDNWSEKASSLNRMGYNISVSNFIENIDYEDGSDIADLFIEGKDEVKELSELDKMIVKNPAVSDLIRTFDLNTDKYSVQCN